MQNFQWLIKNKVEFQRKTKKTSCKISRGLDFLALKFARDVTYISVPNFQEWSFVLPGFFMGTEHKKNSRVFFKKVCPQTPPPCFFSGIAHSRTIELNWSYKALAQREALTLCQDRAFASFSCVLSSATVLGRFIHLYCDTVSLGRGALLFGK